MNRRNFIITNCTACLASAILPGILTSCRSTRYITGVLGKDGLIIRKNDFQTDKKRDISYHSFLIVRNEALQYPICVYRFGDNEYTALWMQCTHQGTELQASGDSLQCAAHGSEFNNKGHVMNGPATADLRVFPVTIMNDELFIDLRKP